MPKENNIREIKPKPDKDIIAKLEELLEQAKTGDIQFLIYIVDRRNNLSTGEFGHYREESKVLGLIEVMKYRILKQMPWQDTT